MKIMYFLIILLFLLLILYHTLACPCTNILDNCLTTASEGDLCKECNYRGFKTTIDGLCTCTSSEFNPEDNCLKPGESQLYQQVEVIQSKATCSCYTDYINGFFKLNSNDTEKKIVDNTFKEKHVYGDPFPPVCTYCYSDLYGPPPQTITASDEFLNIKACTQLGSPDPEQYFLLSVEEREEGDRRLLLEREYAPPAIVELLDWQSCGGHGVWNDTTHTCDCDLGWGLMQSPFQPLDYFGNKSYICIKCLGPYGPYVPWEQQTANIPPPPFCYAPWTPDPLAGGKLKICSGHGDFLLGECRCYQNSTAGYWQLTPYTMSEETILNTFEIVEKEYTVLTCIGCLEGFKGPLCNINSTQSPIFPTTANPTIPTLSPTLSPTLNPTTNPTLSPTLNPTTNPTLTPTFTPTKNPTLVPTLSPTLSPTTNPTLTPTFSPTQNPTQVPTISPTLDQTVVFYYLDNLYQGGEFGGIEGAKQLCTLESYKARANGVTNVFPVLSNSTQNVTDIPKIYNFDGDSTIVTGTTGGVVANTWNDMFVPSPSPAPTVVLLQSVNDASPTPFSITPSSNPEAHIWTGTEKNGGLLLPNCNEWTSSLNSDESYIGLVDFVNTRWIRWTSSGRTCDQDRRILCGALIEGTQYPTLEPTLSPTLTPTLTPTVSPTEELYHLIVYNPVEEYLGGGVEAQNDICYSKNATAGESCRNIFALLSSNSSYQMIDFPTYFDFDATKTVVQRPDKTQISSTFGDMFVPTSTPAPTPVLDNTMFAGGAIMITGTESDGTVSSNTCNQFTSTSNGDTSTVGLSNSVTKTWTQFVDNSACDTTRFLYCGCLVEGTRTPTANPI